jgi:hypothetical protein
MELKFTKVKVFAKLRGHQITNSISAPLGISYAEYQKIDRDAVRAFGNEGTRTIATFADGTIIGFQP